MSDRQDQVWDLRETAEDRALKEKVRALAASLRRTEKKVRRIHAECLALQSYQEADRMFEAGLEDPPTVGFNLSGALEGTIEDLSERAEHLEKAAAETVEDLLRDRSHGTADLGKFLR
jgi:hypothetical protein